MGPRQASRSARQNDSSTPRNQTLPERMAGAGVPYCREASPVGSIFFPRGAVAPRGAPSPAARQRQCLTLDRSTVYGTGDSKAAGGGPPERAERKQRL